MVEKSIVGDAEAFRLLVRALDGKLFSYVSYRTQTREDALDTLQDVFIDLWKALPRFTYVSDEAFYRFLFTIAKRNVQHAWGRRKTVSLEEVGEVADTKEAQTTEEKVVLHRALQKLDEKAKDIVILRHWSGYSFKEIGVLLSMKEEAVRVRHHRALHTLGKTLHAYVT